MNLQFLGATGTVTGSKYLLRVGDKRILVDCGLFQGFKQLRLRNWSPLPVDPRRIDAVVLTHAHIDHSGYLPLLVNNGFKGRVHCSRATRDLCEILLPDSGHLQEEEAKYANRASFSRHHPALPLYTREEAETALRSLRAVDFGQSVTLKEGVSFELLPAGHILGAAVVVLTAGQRRIVFSGDLGRANDPIMPPPAAVDRADYLVVESTYGNRDHSKLDPESTLAEILNRTIARGGVVIVPAFAVGRTNVALLHRPTQG